MKINLNVRTKTGDVYNDWPIPALPNKDGYSGAKGNQKLSVDCWTTAGEDAWNIVVALDAPIETCATMTHVRALAELREANERLAGLEKRETQLANALGYDFGGWDNLIAKVTETRNLGNELSVALGNGSADWKDPIGQVKLMKAKLEQSESSLRAARNQFYTVSADLDRAVTMRNESAEYYANELGQVMGCEPHTNVFVSKWQALILLLKTRLNELEDIRKVAKDRREKLDVALIERDEARSKLKQSQKQTDEWKETPAMAQELASLLVLDPDINWIERWPELMRYVKETIATSVRRRKELWEIRKQLAELSKGGE